GIRFSQQLSVEVEQGALRQVSLRLPAALPEAVVSGQLLREMRTRVENGERIYDCSFQTDVLDAAALTFDIDLPLGADFDVPFVKVADAGRLTRWFVLDNASAREAKITTKTALESVARDAVPYLPADLVRPEFFRATEDGALKVAYQQLTSTEGNAALITLADLTTLLRADGTRWDIARYSLINRSLQFLPVILPEGAELITVSVSGAPVRADEETVSGKRVRLIPLIHTRPGQRALDVKLVYRFRAAADGLAARTTLDDPELPGLSVERTTWTVWTPQGHQLASFDGNMEEVGKEGQELQQLEGMLSELGEANRLLARGDLNPQTAMLCYTQAKELTQKIQEKKQSTLERIVSNGLTDLLDGRYEKKLDEYSARYVGNDQMDDDVVQQGTLLENNWRTYSAKGGKLAGKKTQADGNTFWSFNKSGEGTLKLNDANTFTGSVAVNGGQLLNDNIAVDNLYFGNQVQQQDGREPQKVPLGVPLATGRSETISGVRSGGIAIQNGVVDNLLVAGAPIQLNGGTLNLNGAVQQGQLMVGNNAVNSNARANNLSQLRVSEPSRSISNVAAEQQTRAEPSNRSTPAAMSAADPFGAAPVGGAMAAAAVSSPAAPAPRAEPLKEQKQEADAPQIPAEMPQALKPTGRHALDIEPPAEGVVHHYSKLKDHAVLEITLKLESKQGQTARVVFLCGGLLLCAGLWRWTGARRAAIGQV
ncbi:MAG: hypothetical protein JNN17_00725, partial [Verrucomicrobiaceae bacterium]|nr:hypothetical protein [Verrucomicrobiaceae bacterium]